MTSLSAANRSETGRLLALAWPVTLATLQWVVLNLIDTAMVGHAGTAELAFMNAGRIVVWTAVMICFGLLSGVIVFVSRADGAGTPERCGDYLRQGLMYGSVLAVTLSSLMALAAEPLLRGIGIPPDQTAGGAGFVQIMALALLFRIVGLSIAYFLEGVSRPLPVMVLALGTLPLNAALNWVFVFGKFGLPAMGARGAALGTALSVLAEMIGLFVYVSQIMPERARFGLTGTWLGPWRSVWPAGRALRRFGLAPAASSGMEIIGFGVLGVIAAQISMSAAASFQAVNALHSMALCIPVGFASAAGVRVGNAVGEQAFADVARRAWLAVAMTILFTAIMVGGFAVAPHALLSVFSETDTAMLGTAYIMLMWTLPCIVFDAVQIVLVYALRAAGDPVYAALNQGISCLIVMGGSAWVCVHLLGMGALGLTAGLGIGVVVSAALMAARFWWITQRSGVWIATRAAAAA